MSSFQGFPTQFRLNWTHVGMEVKLQDGPGFSEVSQRFLRIRGHPPSGFPRMLLDHLSQTEKQSRSMAGAQLLPEILWLSAAFEKCLRFSEASSIFLCNTDVFNQILCEMTFLLLCYSEGTFLRSISHHERAQLLKYTPPSLSFGSRPRASRNAVITDISSYNTGPSKKQKQSTSFNFQNLCKRTTIPFRSAMKTRWCLSWSWLVPI